MIQIEGIGTNILVPLVDRSQHAEPELNRAGNIIAQLTLPGPSSQIVVPQRLIVITSVRLTIQTRATFSGNEE